MNQTLNLLPLSPYLSTSYHMQELLAALEKLQTAHFQRKQHFLTTLEQEIPFPLSETLKQLATTHKVNFDDLVQTETFFNLIRQEIEKLPHLTLTVSISPTIFLIKEINQWLVTNLKQPMILDFIVDETIIGGAKIAFKGKLIDHTVKKQIEGLQLSV